jgi:hypothetical protein
LVVKAKKKEKKLELIFSFIKGKYFGLICWWLEIRFLIASVYRENSVEITTLCVRRFFDGTYI